MLVVEPLVENHVREHRAVRRRHAPQVPEHPLLPVHAPGRARECAQTQVARRRSRLACAVNVRRGEECCSTVLCKFLGDHLNRPLRFRGRLIQFRDLHHRTQRARINKDDARDKSRRLQLGSGLPAQAEWSAAVGAGSCMSSMVPHQTRCLFVYSYETAPNARQTIQTERRRTGNPRPALRLDLHLEHKPPRFHAHVLSKILYAKYKRTRRPAANPRCRRASADDRNA